LDRSKDHYREGFYFNNSSDVTKLAKVLDLITNRSHGRLGAKWQLWGFKMISNERLVELSEEKFLKADKF